jgi:hypothetical protein
MKITDIRTIPLSFRAPNPAMSAGGANAARNALLPQRVYHRYRRSPSPLHFAPLPQWAGQQQRPDRS